MILSGMPGLDAVAGNARGDSTPRRRRSGPSDATRFATLPLWAPRLAALVLGLLLAADGHAAPMFPHLQVAAAAGHAGTPPQPPSPPNSSEDLDAWLNYKIQAGVPSLPLQARLFHRLGIHALSQHDDETALRMLRGASDLDPSFLEPHLSLIGMFTLWQPSQALLQAAAIVDLVRDRFGLQLALVANGFFYLIHGLFFGLLLTGLLLAAIHARELRHTLEERLKLLVSAPSARLWAMALLGLPFCAGWGLALPAALLLGLLWPYLKARERVVPVLLAAALASAPLVGVLFDRLAIPLRPDTPPLYGAQAFEDVSDHDGAVAELQTLAARDPENPFIQFSLGWNARRAKDYVRAEQAYRKALERWPHPDRLLNNLGNVLAFQGRSDEATAAYQQAIQANPDNAAAYYNLAQLHTQSYDYARANEALAAASARDFELVRSHQAQISTDGSLPLIDTWIDPPTFWSALMSSAPPPSGQSLPLAWRGRMETSGWGFSVVALLLVAGSVLLGKRLHRELPARHCASCPRVICRRCAVRLREHAHCRECAKVAARAESPEFARVLLGQHARQRDRRRSLVRTAAAALVPGLGLLTHRRVFTPLLLLGATMVLLGGWVGASAPFPYEPSVGPARHGALAPFTLAAWIAIYAISLGGYFIQTSRAAAQARALARPVSQRVRQSTAAAA